ncbi:MAG: type II toxin-antitoxin system Phd/YefM family antitoxin [Candidatus Eremiobacteraeota bacterium]|nr:type II toxin-antitoxin system Phd/YefM family antitoxin [Candidatus Eremiobacteraeota bacterium]MCW5866520.1 type II toxin-antitoxin system Phd/YefM family antitoxin [Candidatus Eremiobacteraeota bacterium]
MRIINVHEAKTHLSKLLEDVKAGEEIVLAKMGKPYARLVPIDQPKPVRLGFLSGSVGDDILQPMSDEELADWEGPIHP